MSVSVSLNLVVAFSLVFARFTGFFMFAPIFSTRSIPPQVKAGLIMILTLITVPTISPKTVDDIPTDAVGFGLILAKEVLVGYALAFAVSIIFSAVQIAGSLLDMQIGYAMATLLDPMTNTQTSILGQLYSQVGIMSFLVLDGHVLMLGGLFKSFQLIPLDGWPHAGPLAGQAVLAVAQLFVIGMQVAAPVFVAAFIVDFSLGLIVRAVPQANIYAVGMPVKVVVGLVSVAATLPAFLLFFNDKINQAISQMSQLAISLLH